MGSRYKSYLFGNVTVYFDIVNRKTFLLPNPLNVIFNHINIYLVDSSNINALTLVNDINSKYRVELTQKDMILGINELSLLGVIPSSFPRLFSE